MPKYVVYRTVDVTYRFFVEAENEAEALAKAEDLYVEQGDFAEWERSTTDAWCNLYEGSTP